MRPHQEARCASRRTARPPHRPRPPSRPYSYLNASIGSNLDALRAEFRQVAARSAASSKPLFAAVQPTRVPAAGAVRQERSFFRRNAGHSDLTLFAKKSTRGARRDEIPPGSALRLPEDRPAAPARPRSRPYSYLNASIGSNLDALRAG
jgi:hypothetical protein